MPKQTGRPYRLIGFKAYFDGDEAIIDWWENMEDGSRSDAIRELIREALGFKPQRTRSNNVRPELVEVQQHTRWIRQALNDMPSYLEDLIAHAQPVMVTQAAPAMNAPVSQKVPLERSQSQRRARKLKRASW